MSYFSNVIMSNKIKNMNLVELKSVGSWVDTNSGIVYPSFVNNKPDFDCPISLVEDEVASDWYDALSHSEYGIVSKFINSGSFA